MGPSPKASVSEAPHAKVPENTLQGIWGCVADLRNVVVNTLAWHQVYKVESNAWDLGRETVLQLVLVRKVWAP